MNINIKNWAVGIFLTLYVGGHIFYPELAMNIMLVVVMFYWIFGIIEIISILFEKEK